MNAAAYISAAIPEPYRILGLRMLPFSLGRYRILRRLECAFVSDEETNASISDLIIGVLACSMPCRDFLAFASTASFYKEIKQWSRRICPLPILGLMPIVGKWWRKRTVFDVHSKMELFKRYLKEGGQMPEYWVLGEESNEPSTLHWSQSLAITLRSQLGWSELEIEEEPLSRAFMDVLALGEAQGRLQIMTDEEKAMGEANAKALAALELN